ncbi:MAG TPA: hypothetical protein VLU25_05755, partial [Acidobacteriota bacterium]|nr:hypothetical protein [Acidobacteriota bacterium]
VMPERLQHRPAANEAAKLVNRVCQDLDLTRGELAELMGLSGERTIFMWIEGRNALKGANLKRLQNAAKSIDEGFPADAVKRFCLADDGSLGEIRTYLNRLQKKS